jgi:hypothetical protein
MQVPPSLALRASLSHGSVGISAECRNQRIAPATGSARFGLFERGPQARAERSPPAGPQRGGFLDCGDSSPLFRRVVPLAAGSPAAPRLGPATSTSSRAATRPLCHLHLSVAEYQRATWSDRASRWTSVVRTLPPTPWAPLVAIDAHRRIRNGPLGRDLECGDGFNFAALVSRFFFFPPGRIAAPSHLVTPPLVVPGWRPSYA